jgi:major membrane immunogen (membrane-anchored lipoprotein)
LESSHFCRVLPAQRARIDGVSGATVAGDGYRQLLQAALDAAHRR